MSRDEPMPRLGVQTRQTFLKRVGVGGLILGGSLWSSGPALAKKRPRVPAWTSNRRNLTGPFANALYAVAADRTGKKTYFAKCDGSGAIQFAQSVDEGLTFAPFKAIAGISDASDVPLDRSLVVDEVTKRVHLLYSVNVDSSSEPASLRYIHSDNGGASWSSPLTLDDGVASTGLNHGPNRFIRVAMAASGGIVHIGWVSIDSTTFLTDGMFQIKSTNGGKSFSAPGRPFAGTVSPSRPDIAMVGDTVLFAWTDARFGSAYNGNPGEVFLGRSTNGGSTWTQTRLTFTAKTWGAGSTLRPVICAGPKGTVTVVWQDPNSPAVSGAAGVTGFNSAGTEDLYWIHSSDGGARWGEIHVLERAASVQNHAYLAQSGNVVGCVWADGRSSPAQMRFKLSTDGGATFSPSTQPMVSAADAAAPRIVASEDFLQAYTSEGGNGIFEARLPYRGLVVPLPKRSG